MRNKALNSRVRRAQFAYSLSIRGEVTALLVDRDSAQTLADGFRSVAVTVIVFAGGLRFFNDAFGGMDIASKEKCQKSY
jgi:hypothetical protein